MRRVRLFDIVSVCLAAAFAVFAFASLIGAIPAVVAYFMLAVSSSAQALMFVAWFAILCTMPMVRVVAILAFALIASSFAVLLFSILNPQWIILSLLAVALAASALCYRKAVEGISKDSLDVSGHTGSVSSSWTFPWKPILLSCLVSMVVGLTQLQGEAGTSWLVIGVGCLLGVGIVLGAASRTIDFMLLQRICALLVVSSALCMPFASLMPVGFGATLSMVASTMFILFVETLLCGIVLRYRMSVAWLFGVFLAVQSVGFLLSEMVDFMLSRVAHGEFEIAIVASVLAVLTTGAFLFFMTDKDMHGAWGMRTGLEGFSSEASAGFPADPMSFGENQRHRLYDISFRFGLTKREEEVCLLLAQGQTTSDIERLLVLSNSTVKSHIAHIYKKLDVHSIDEFKEVFYKQS